MKLLCIEFSDPHWIEVIARVVAKTGAKPVYWTGSAGREGAVRTAFPGIVFHENLLAVRGVPAVDWTPQVLHYPDASVLDGLSGIQTLALKMMDRMDSTGTNFGFEARQRHYYRLVAYWTSVLDEFQPGAVLMPIAPHLVYDFVLYGLCRLRGIATLLFDRTAIPGRVLPMDAYDGASSSLRDRYTQRLAEGCPIDLPRDVMSYLNSLQGDCTSGMAPNFKLKMERLALTSTSGGIGKPSLLQIIRHEARGIYNNLARQGFRVPRNYLKVNHRPPESYEVGHVGYYLNRWRGIAEKARLRGQYLALQSDFDLQQPYVFVALHFQPERNTVPLGGHYADQLLLVALLASTLPRGWKIYVKEHGWQLQPYSRGQHGRTGTFYADLVALPNVELVPIETPSFQLIDHARAVATVSGSVGWEGINRGKPTLIFGDAWYQDCEGVIRIRTFADGAAAFARIEAGMFVDRERIWQYVAALEDVALRAVLEFNLEARGEISEDVCINSLANSFVDRLQALQRSVPK